MEVPYNVYKFLVARRQFEDDDMAKKSKALQRNTRGQSSVKKAMPIKPVDVEKDPVIFDTWNRMKSAASEKIVDAVKK